MIRIFHINPISNEELEPQLYPQKGRFFFRYFIRRMGTAEAF